MAVQDVPGQVEPTTSDDANDMPTATLLGATTAGPIGGSLPADVCVGEDTPRFLPALVLAPVHLRALEPAPTAIQADGGPAPRAPAAVARDGFVDLADSILQPADPTRSRFTAKATDASYDFDEYVFLRAPGSPYWAADDAALTADPRMTELVLSVRAQLLQLEREALGAAYQPSAHEARLVTLADILAGVWYAVSAVRLFNRLQRHDRAAFPGKSPETFCAERIRAKLAAEAWPADRIRRFIAAPPESATDQLLELLQAAVWERTLAALVDQLAAFPVIDPSAPEHDYAFESFAPEDILFGLRVVHRQRWRLLDYGRGDLVKTIPLGPRETQKVSVKATRRSKTARGAEEAATVETTGEQTVSAKDTSDVVQESAYKVNRHLEAEASGGVGAFFQAKISGGLADERSRSSKETKSRLNESMQKTASRIKRDTKVTISVEGEQTYEETAASELVNPNDEIGITYLYHRLQQRYWVSTEIAEVDSVVLVAEPLPAWDEIGEEWLRQHGDILAGALLDASFAGTLAAIRHEPNDLSYDTGDVFSSAARTGIEAAGKSPQFQGGFLPDMLASGQQFYERDFERRNNLKMEQRRRQHQLDALVTHIRRNILHYMRAIWSSEDHDQRMQRYSRLRVPTAWTFVPYSSSSPVSAQSAPDMQGTFVARAGSERPLTEIIDPVGPIGYLFNCALYRLRDDPRAFNTHQALAYLRAAYARFSVRVTVAKGAGVRVRQAVAWSPRSFAASYPLVYRHDKKAWFLERPLVEIPRCEDGSLDVFGIRVWLDGAPVQTGDVRITVDLLVTSEPEDPHLKLVQVLHPLPARADEPATFTDELLAQLATTLAETGLAASDALTWGSLTPDQRQTVRRSYHRFLMLRDSGRLVTLDTGNLVLDLEASQAPALEPFKRLHRYLDVMKEHEEYRRRQLESARRERLLDKGALGDPDIERVTVTNAKALGDLVVVESDEPS